MHPPNGGQITYLSKVKGSNTQDINPMKSKFMNSSYNNSLLVAKSINASKDKVFIDLSSSG